MLLPHPLGDFVQQTGHEAFRRAAERRVGHIMRFRRCANDQARPMRLLIGGTVRLAALALIGLLSSGALGTAPTPTPTNTPIPLGDPGNPVTSNAQWQPFITVQDFDGVPMVKVPAGCFMMGSDDGQDDEKPAHQQCFDAPFWIDQTEVTQKQFADFNGTAERASNFPGENRPVENITWLEARDFCALRGARLPTEAEWEYAARGPDALVYPWGDEFIGDNAVYGENSDGQTAEVGSRPAGASWVGAFDMSGNVWEWTSTIYGIDDPDQRGFSSTFDYPYQSDDGREQNNDEITNIRVLHGGSWVNSNTDGLRAANRSRDYPDYGIDSMGFRCARSA